MYRIIGIVSIFSLCFLTQTHAQFDSSLSPDVSISVIPADPAPGEAIILQAESYSGDLSQALLSWRYNGTPLGSGVGKTRISATAPQSGSATISLAVSGAGMTPSTSTMVIRSAAVDLLWEAVDSYTPAFYKGKALLAPNGWVRATAIPAPSAPKNLSYEWTRNDEVIPEASGYNKSSMVFKNDTLKSQESLSVSALSNSYSGSDSTSIKTVAPLLLTYQNSSGFTDYTKAYASALTTTATGVTLVFEPYFFSIPESMKKDLVFTIQNGDNTLSGDKAPNELSLSAPEIKGESILDITIHTAMYSLQNIVQRFKILFQ